MPKLNLKNMKILWSDATTNDEPTNEVGENGKMNNFRNSNSSTPLPNVHHHDPNSTLSGDSNHSEEVVINEALNLNASNLESLFPNIIFA